MANLGRKFTCYSCHTKFYDLGNPVPTCPKCGADQRDAEEAPVVTSSRGKRVVVVEEPVEEEFSPEVETEEAEIEDEEIVDAVEPEEEDDEEEEEEF